MGVISSIEGNLKELIDEKKKQEADDYKEQQTKHKALQVDYPLSRIASVQSYLGIPVAVGR